MSTSYSWEGKGRYGSFRLRIERVGMQVKLWDPFRTRAIPERFWGDQDNSRIISSLVMIHKEALYQVYVPLLLTSVSSYTCSVSSKLVFFRHFVVFMNGDVVVFYVQCQHSILRVQRSRCAWMHRSGPGRSSWECPLVLLLLVKVSFCSFYSFFGANLKPYFFSNLQPLWYLWFLVLKVFAVYYELNH